MVAALQDTLPAISLISGGIAGGVEGFLTYPFEFAKTRAQLSPHHSSKTSSAVKAVPRNPFLALRHIYLTEGGIRALYSGVGALVIGSVAKDAVRFLSFDTVKNAFKDPETGRLTPARNMLADDLRPGGENKYKGRGTLYTVRTIVQESGWRGLYRGLVGTTLKQASATSFRMGSYNIVKDFEEQRGIPQTTVVNFANGAVAGTVTTLATMPFDNIKTRCQSARGEGAGEAIRGIWGDGGVKGFWRGTIMRGSRTVFSGGILFTTAEAVAKILNPIFGR